MSSTRYPPLKETQFPHLFFFLDLLFAELTVKEHLEFYGKLKGLTGESLQTDISYLLTKMGLQEKANSLCNQLSGGR